MIPFWGCFVETPVVLRECSSRIVRDKSFPQKKEKNIIVLPLCRNQFTLSLISSNEESKNKRIFPALICFSAHWNLFFHCTNDFDFKCTWNLYGAQGVPNGLWVLKWYESYALPFTITISNPNWQPVVGVIDRALQCHQSMPRIINLF